MISNRTAEIVEFDEVEEQKVFVEVADLDSTNTTAAKNTGRPTGKLRVSPIEEEVVEYDEVDVDDFQVQNSGTTKSKAPIGDVSIVRVPRRSQSRSVSIRNPKPADTSFVVHGPSDPYARKRSRAYISGTERRSQNPPVHVTAIDMTGGGKSEADLIKERKRIQNLRRLNLPVHPNRKNTRIGRRRTTKEGSQNRSSQKDDDQLDDTTEDTEQEVLKKRGGHLGKRPRGRPPGGANAQTQRLDDGVGALSGVAKRSADMLKVASGFGLNGIINQLPSESTGAIQESGDKIDIQIDSVKHEEVSSHGRTALFGFASSKQPTSVFESCSIYSLPNLVSETGPAAKTKILAEEQEATKADQKKVFTLSTNIAPAASESQPAQPVGPKKRGRKPGNGKKAQATSLVLVGAANGNAASSEDSSILKKEEETSLSLDTLRIKSGAALRKYMLAIKWHPEEVTQIKDFDFQKLNPDQEGDEEGNQSDFEKSVAKLIDCMSTIFERTQDELLEIIDTNQYNMKKVVYQLCVDLLQTIPKSLVIEEDKSEVAQP